MTDKNMMHKLDSLKSKLSSSTFILFMQYGLCFVVTICAIPECTSFVLHPFNMAKMHSPKISAKINF